MNEGTWDHLRMLLTDGDIRDGLWQFMMVYGMALLLTTCWELWNLRRRHPQKQMGKVLKTKNWHDV